MSDTTFLHDGPREADAHLLLAHGAGQGMDAPFMAHFAAALAAADPAQGIRVWRFEFPYMREARRIGKRRPPDREAALLDCWRETVAGRVDAGMALERLFIGGKSMGGRMASLVADELGVAGLVCLGYPFHPPGRPEKLRTAHLESLRTPTLICQGERDTFGKREEVDGYALSASICVEWMGDGDHGFKPRKRSGLTEEQNIETAARIVARFMRGVGA